MDVLKRFRTPILIGAGALVFAVVLYTGLISPQGHKLSSLKSQESTLQDQQVQLQSEIATLKREKAHMATSCAELNKAITEIPGTPDVSAFLQQVTSLAVNTGNPNTPTISVLQAPSSGGGGGATPVQVSLTLNGDYGQVSAFIKGLDSFPRLFSITSISVNGGPIATAGGAISPATPSYTLQLTGDIYYSSGRLNVCQAGSGASAGA
jgi:Tfp pilus assembly protein PilO